MGRAKRTITIKAFFMTAFRKGSTKIKKGGVKTAFHNSFNF